ncbi:glycosyltransferase family 4 protein [Aquaticitalea lipolytica]|uniref:glycosyltransferase family 4 protein n=1 Tax=Aquaticitalea lipolytica TaxID=1247562 RepID=UPI0024B97662|nr:glycosyltransferase family 4 protein [Aquaticitalea lipolytica]
MLDNKVKILFLMQLPPPVHGASMMNKYIKDSKKVNASFDAFFLPLSFAEKVDDIGKISLKKILKMIAFCFKLTNNLFKIKPKIVYFTIAPFGGAFYRDVLFVIIIKLFRKKIVFHLHGKGIAEESKSFIKKKIYQFVFKNTYVITLSKMLDYDIRKVFNGKIYHLANGIEINNSYIKTNKNDRIKILYLSNLVKTKGVLDLVDALVILKDLKSNYEVNIVGNSADISIEELKEMVINKNTASKINILGPKYGEEKWQELCSSDIFVFPTYFKNECFPLVLLEAMQSGNAIISTDNGAIEEIIINCGLIVPQNSPTDLAEAIKSLIINKDKVQALKEKSKKEFDEKYTLQIFEENFIKTINSILNETLQS